MTDAERRKRILDVNFLERVTGELGWFYISFADDDAWLGGCYVKAHGFGTACEMAHRLKINPGGQAYGGRVPEGGMEQVPAEYRCRLLTLADLETLHPGQVTTVGKWREEHGRVGGATIDQDKP